MYKQFWYDIFDSTIKNMILIADGGSTKADWIALNADKDREKKEKIAFTKSINEYLKNLEKYQT